MYPHDAGHASILPHGERLYLNTSNGVDNTHRRIRAPDAAALIALDKRTGHLLARDEERMGPRTFHCTWSSPALGEANGRTLIFFGGPDGVLYAFDALRETPEPNSVARLKKLWSFDCDPNTPKENVHKYVSNRRESPSNIMGMPVFHQGRVYVAAGGDVWWGKRQSWLKCVDANTGAEVWSSPLNSHCCTTPAIADDLVFITDCGKTLHCLDAHTGKPHWTHQLNGDIWASPLVADGKVYVGSRKRDFHILAAAKEKKVLCSVELDSAISNSCAAADGVLYLATMEKLYALRKPRPPGGDNRQ
jgi:outer membrane protein assembly factor BamB